MRGFTDELRQHHAEDKLGTTFEGILVTVSGGASTNGKLTLQP